MESMTFSSEIAEIAAAHSLFMGAVRDVSKDQDGYGYKYADLSQLLEVARPLLEEHGLSVLQFASYQGYAPENVRALPDVNGFVPHLIGDAVVETLVTHSSGQWMRGALSLPVETKKGLSVAQCVGMAITYARRYSAAGVLGIAQHDDDAQPGQGAPAGGSGSKAGNAGRAPKANGGQARVIPADQAKQLEERVRAIGKDPANFARVVANVKAISQIPAAKLDNAAAMLDKAEKAAAARAAQASTQGQAGAADEAAPDEGEHAAANAG